MQRVVQAVKFLIAAVLAIAVVVASIPALVWLARLEAWSVLGIALVAGIVVWGAPKWWGYGGRILTMRLLAVAYCMIGGMLFLTHWDGAFSSQSQAARDVRAEERAKALAEQRLAAALKIVDQNTAAELEHREKLEARQREEAELKALRRSNPDEYLKRLREKDILKFVEEAKVLRPKVYAAYQEEVRKLNEAMEMDRQRRAPESYITLAMTWRKGGFESVMLATFTLKSTLLFPVRDIVVSCKGYGNSGTKIWSGGGTIFETLPAKANKRMPELNLGFIPQQMSSAGCEILAVKAY